MIPTVSESLIDPTILHSRLLERLSQRLEMLHDTRHYRTMRALEPTLGTPLLAYQGRVCVDFSSNDYLGLSAHADLIEASVTAVKQYGTSSSSSRLIRGTTQAHSDLEALIRQFKSAPAALVYNSGYQANVGLLSALAKRHDTVWMDRDNHASLVDGVILSRAKLKRYSVDDLEALDAQLAQARQDTPQNDCFIVTDTVFSMDGRLAPLYHLFELAERHDAWLILDEAHATGLYGPSRRSGLWETTHLGPHPRVIQVGTFSKALGGFGAYVAGHPLVIETLINQSRSFIYSTALPVGVIAANHKAMEWVLTSDVLTQQLWHNVSVFQQGLQSELNVSISGTSPIVPIILGDETTALQCAESLLAAGFFVQAIRPPTVPQQTCRLRFSLSAVHTESHLNQVIDALKPWRHHIIV